MTSSQRPKSILVGVTGGIAAYKSVFFVRELVKNGYDVQVVMTEGAKAFVQPLTFQAVSGKAVRDSLLDPAAELGMGHIELARWADLIVIAPATADFLAKLAYGHASDLLSTICLAARCPIAIAPAMNQAMYSHPATQANLELLKGNDRCHLYHVWGPESGEQACGDVGAGRMMEPEALSDQVDAYFRHHEIESQGKLGDERLLNKPLTGKKVIVTAGPTREAIDPVRYISNHSSGKMGYAVAEACSALGAEVVLISGPTQLQEPAGVTCLKVVTAMEMYNAATQRVNDGADIFIASAAVADYRPATEADQKIKKTNEEMTIHLVKNPDIVSHIASMKPKPFVVGFAAETRDVEHYARDKLARKGLDLIVANDVSDKTIGFNSDDNAALLIWPEGSRACPKQSKDELASEIVRQVISLMQGQERMIEK